jgi:hypothetical protein
MARAIAAVIAGPGSARQFRVGRVERMTLFVHNKSGRL